MKDKEEKRLIAIYRDGTEEGTFEFYSKHYGPKEAVLAYAREEQKCFLDRIFTTLKS